MAELKRRQFLKTSAWAGASLVGTSHRWANANDRIRVALIGAGGRGGALVRDTYDVEGVEIVTVCDVDERRSREDQRQEAPDRKGHAAHHGRPLRGCGDDRHLQSLARAGRNLGLSGG